MRLRDLPAGAGALLGRAVNEDVVRLAVTGLSRAGKTVFITSLLQNLVALGGGRDTLPRFSQRLGQSGASTLRAVSLVPPGSAALPWFDFAAKRDGLAAAAPAWPDRTTDLATVALELTLARSSPVGRLLGERRLRLEILDYPGEWLLDLPLLKQSFAAWSAQTLALLREPPRRAAAARFLAFVANLRPGDRVNDTLVREGHAHYKAGLEVCRTNFGLRYLQPGRFLCPGPHGDLPLFWFFPLDIPPGLTPAADSLWAQLEDRFAAYKDHVRSQFFDTHFRAFDRQVVLVDLLGALCAGAAAFDDTAWALREIAAELRYGAAGLLRLPGRRIGRVAFAATKADHVPALTRDNLRHLLRDLAPEAEYHQVAAGAAVGFGAVAALCATTDGTADFAGRPVPVVLGRVLGEDRVRPFYAGTVPVQRPGPEFWSNRFFELPQFRPPGLDPSGRSGLPHLGLDAVLDDLLGDLL